MINKMLFKLLIFVCIISASKQLEEDFVSSVTQGYTAKVNSRLEQQILGYNNHELAYKAYAAYFARADVALPGFKKLFESQSERARELAQSLITYVNLRGGMVNFPVVNLKDVCKGISEALIQESVTTFKQTKSQSFPARNKPHICYFQSSNPDPFETYKKKAPTKSDSDWWPFKKEKDPKKAENVVEETKHENWPQALYAMEDVLAMEKHFNVDQLQLVEEVKTVLKDPHARKILEDFLDKQVTEINKFGNLVTKLREYQSEGSYDLGEYVLDKDLDS